MNKKAPVNINALNRRAFLQYLETIIVTGDFGREIDGQFFDQTRNRAYYRWREERAEPDFFAADRWLSYFSIHIDEYFNFCQQQGINPWAGKEPEWHAGGLISVEA